LDAKLRVQARAEISKLHMQLGTTFIYVTHDQVEAMTMGNRIAVMKDGRLQQVDTPQALYARPANLFVAGFIGSPAMNFFQAKLREQEGTLWVDTGAFRVPIPPHQADPYRHYAGKSVIFGIRPENIHDPQYQPPGIQPAPVRAKVSVTELIGHEVILHLSTTDREGILAEQEFVARVDPRTQLRVNQWAEVVFDMDRFHLFDPQTEQRLG
jgi:multiple sugar transport system ATP-binding protein